MPTPHTTRERRHAEHPASRHAERHGAQGRTSSREASHPSGTALRAGLHPSGTALRDRHDIPPGRVDTTDCFQRSGLLFCLPGRRASARQPIEDRQDACPGLRSEHRKPLRVGTRPRRGRRRAGSRPRGSNRHIRNSLHRRKGQDVTPDQGFKVHGQHSFRSENDLVCPHLLTERERRSRDRPRAARFHRSGAGRPEQTGVTPRNTPPPRTRPIQ